MGLYVLSQILEICTREIPLKVVKVVAFALISDPSIIIFYLSLTVRKLCNCLGFPTRVEVVML